MNAITKEKATRSLIGWSQKQHSENTKESKNYQPRQKTFDGSSQRDGKVNGSDFGVQ